jgi:hypothetical protein
VLETPGTAARADVTWRGYCSRERSERRWSRHFWLTQGASATPLAAALLGLGALSLMLTVPCPEPLTEKRA